MKTANNDEPESEPNNNNGKKVDTYTITTNLRGFFSRRLDRLIKMKAHDGMHPEKLSDDGKKLINKALRSTYEDLLRQDKVWGTPPDVGGS